MTYKNFPSEILSAIDLALKNELRKTDKPIAVFDADGTLWDTDIGENFFLWQIANAGLKLPDNPWDFYREMKSRNDDPRAAYLWLAQICQGRKLNEVRDWAKRAVEKQQPLAIYPAQKTLIEHFHKSGVEVYVVTASIKWSVEPAAALLGIPEHRVLGVSTKTVNDFVSAEQEGFITYREGKMQELLRITGGRRPFFGCGNTLGDISLLNDATEVSLAVCSAPAGAELHLAEQALQAEAKAHNWLRHSFSYN